MPLKQTTNLGVRSSNLFGRASNSLILNQDFCAIFPLLTSELFGAAPGQHASWIDNVEAFSATVMDTFDLGIDALDYWRLCDELTVIQAALLLVGCSTTSNECLSTARL